MTENRLQEMRSHAEASMSLDHACFTTAHGLELINEIDRLKAELAEWAEHKCEFGQSIEVGKLLAENQSLKIRKDGAYLERNKCVVLIANMALALGYNAGRAEHDPNDKEWEDDWRTVVYIDLPSGQISWHFHDSQFDLVAGLPIYDGVWDGHSTELKYQRVLTW